MKICKNIFLVIFIFPCIAFGVNFEISFGGGAATTIEFSYVETEDKNPNGSIKEFGYREDSGVTANGFLDIGANFELLNAGALSSISLLFETGYNYYMRVRTRYKEYPEYKHRFFYHSLILGIMPKLNFDYGISLGIGAGFYLPLYSESSKRKYEENNGLASYYYDRYKEFDFEKILHMHKIAIMPYVKLNLEKNFYMSERWAFKIGANLLYNFGMEYDMDKLKSGSYKYGYDKYNFSSLSFEVFLGFGFGRPK